MQHATSRYALITGASSGIGFEYAKLLAEYGYNLVIVSNEQDALEIKKTALCRDYPVNVVAFCLDLAEPDAALRLFSSCRELKLEVEILINNAGIYHFADFHKEEAAFNEKILYLHVHTPTMLIYYFGNEMIKFHSGYILNMSSITASMPVQGIASYGATKRFLKNFSLALYPELFYQGVSVTVVCPGAVATNLYRLKSSTLHKGMAWGYIITPEKLARKAITAMFKRKPSFTPGWINKVGTPIVASLPMCVLKLLRKYDIFFFFFLYMINFCEDLFL